MKGKDVGAQTAFTWTEQQAHPDVCRGKHKGNPQSEKANRAVEAAKPTLADYIYRWFVEQGEAGATAEECEVGMGGLRRSTTSARIAELRGDWWLLDTGRRRKTSSGCEAAVLRAATKDEHDKLKAAEAGTL